MFSFRLTDEKWIPCVTAEGRREEMSLKDVFLQAQDIREVFDPSPLITVAIHRLLLTVVHRNVGPIGGAGGPRNEKEWEALWKRGWDLQRIHSYFARWQSRFDLFDGQHPFFQCPTMPVSYTDPKGKSKPYTRSIANMFHELATGNNATLFDHTSEDRIRAISCPEAGRLLVAFQGFAVTGLVTHELGQDPKLYKSANNAPLVKSAIVLVKGKNLFQTLMLNLHKYNREDEEPFPSGLDDAPAWERDGETLAEDRLPRGYLDLLTWQSRRIRLIPEGGDGGHTVVRQVVIMKGNQFPDGFSLHQKEPMLAFKMNKKPAKGQDPWPPLAFREDRALWRDSLALFQSVHEERTRPKTLDWLSDLTANGAIPHRATYDLSLTGLLTNQAKIVLWRHERLPLSLKYLEDDKLVAKLKEALAITEDEDRVLRGSVWKLAKLIIAPEVDRLSDTQRKDVDSLADHLAVARPYWAALGLHFRELVERLVSDLVEIDGETVCGSETLPWWADEVRQAARQAFREAAEGLDRTSRVLKAATIAEQSFESGSNSILHAYRRQAGKEGIREQTKH